MIINAELRTVTKTKAMRSLRIQGYIPAVIYGKGRTNMNLTLSVKAFMKQYKSSEHLIELDISGTREYAVIRDIQWHVVKDTVQHVDFQYVDKNSEIKVDIPLTFINESKAPGIKLGGALNILCRYITVKCYPNDMPQGIEIDLSGKMIGQSIHINDVKLPECVKLANYEENFTIVTISSGSSKELQDETK